jgi:hypothetical protein
MDGPGESGRRSALAADAVDCGKAIVVPHDGQLINSVESSR